VLTYVASVSTASQKLFLGFHVTEYVVFGSAVIVVHPDAVQSLETCVGLPPRIQEEPLKAKLVGVTVAYPVAVFVHVDPLRSELVAIDPSLAAAIQ